jgi:hypothetical protein
MYCLQLFSKNKNIQYYKLNIEYIMCKKRNMIMLTHGCHHAEIYIIHRNTQSIKTYERPETD